MDIDLKLEFDNTTQMIHLTNEIIENTDEFIDVVYADLRYSFYIYKEDKKLFDNDIKVYIGGEEVKIDISSGVIKFSQYDGKPFSLMYGYTDITIEVNNILYYSKPLIVAVKENYVYKYEQQLKQMLEDILSDSKQLLTTKNIEQLNYTNISNHKNIEFHREIILLKEIISTYNKNFSAFFINPHSKPAEIYTIEKFEKLSYIDSKTIQHIVENPEELRYSKISTGIFYNNKPVIPKNTLIKNIIKDKNIYENQQIYGFLLYLYKYINERCNNIKKEQKHKQYNLKNIKNGYRCSTEIINLYISYFYEDLKQEFITIKNEIKSLIIKYSKCFNDDVKPINKLPKPTPIFIEIISYNNIYSVMKKWYSVNKMDIPSLDKLLYFPSADKIYELYTLINLYKEICNNGYIEKERYNYKYSIVKYSSELKFENTFVFVKNDEKLILYYQPNIYGDITNKKINGISLLRVDNKFSNYSPDFIIKKVKNNIETYTILDSKWSRLNKSLITNQFKDCLYKYYCSVIDFTNNKPIENLWLINGILNHKKVIYFHNNNSLIKENKFRNKFGIVTLATNYNKYYFANIIEGILS